MEVSRISHDFIKNLDLTDEIRLRLLDFFTMKLGSNSSQFARVTQRMISCGSYVVYVLMLKLLKVSLTFFL